MAKSKQRPKKHTENTQAHKDTLTLKYWLIGAAVIAAVLGLVFLISFLTAADAAVPFTYADGVLTRESDGRTYRKALAVYQVEAFSKSSEPCYGKAGDMLIYKVGYKDTKYDRVVALDENNYLTDGKGALYYSGDVSLPNLSSFDATEVSVGTVMTTDRGETVTYLKTLTNDNSPDATDFIDEYLKNVPYIDGGLPVETCRVKLTGSVKYPWLSMTMHLVRCDNGGENDFYVYTDDNRQSIQISSKWFGDLWKTETTTKAPVTTAVPTPADTPVTTD